MWRVTYDEFGGSSSTFVPDEDFYPAIGSYAALRYAIDNAAGTVPAWQDAHGDVWQITRNGAINDTHPGSQGSPDVRAILAQAGIAPATLAATQSWFDPKSPENSGGGSDLANIFGVFSFVGGGALAAGALAGGAATVAAPSAVSGVVGVAPAVIDIAAESAALGIVEATGPAAIAAPGVAVVDPIAAAFEGFGNAYESAVATSSVQNAVIAEASGQLAAGTVAATIGPVAASEAFAAAAAAGVITQSAANAAITRLAASAATTAATTAANTAGTVATAAKGASLLGSIASLAASAARFLAPAPVAPTYASPQTAVPGGSSASPLGLLLLAGAAFLVLGN